MSNTITIPKKITTVESVNVEVKLPAFYKLDDLGSTIYHHVIDSRHSVYASFMSKDIAMICKTVEGVKDIVTNGTQITREEFEAEFERALKLIVNSIPKA